MRMLSRTAILVFTAATICSSGPVMACGVPIPKLVAGWQNRKAAALKFHGEYREVSRSTSLEKRGSAKRDVETVTVKGVILRRHGKIAATVYSEEFPSLIILCQSGRLPENGKRGTVFAERRADKRKYVIDFEEKRNR